MMMLPSVLKLGKGKSNFSRFDGTVITFFFLLIFHHIITTFLLYLSLSLLLMLFCFVLSVDRYCFGCFMVSSVLTLSTLSAVIFAEEETEKERVQQDLR